MHLMRIRMFLASAIAVAASLAFFAPAKPADAATAHAHTYACTARYDHGLTSASPNGKGGRSSVTTETVTCSPDFTGTFTITASGGREKTAIVGWAGGTVSGKVPFRKTVTTSVTCYPELTVQVTGDVPFSYLPRVSATG